MTIDNNTTPGEKVNTPPISETLRCPNGHLLHIRQNPADLHSRLGSTRVGFCETCLMAWPLVTLPCINGIVGGSR